MKLLSIQIYKAETCGGLLDGFFISFRNNKVDTNLFSPLCLIGPNGSGKSQLLQIITEIFQAAFIRYVPQDESGTENENIEFSLEYLITDIINQDKTIHVRISKRADNRHKKEITIEHYENEAWKITTDEKIISGLLPSKIIGYTSGANETLSIPFFSSRSGYARKVAEHALDPVKRLKTINDPRLLLIDYGTNLEVLVANLLLNSEPIKKKLLLGSNLKSLHSFRCVIQLQHQAAPKKSGIQLTQELEDYIVNLKRCATCFEYNEKTRSYIFDFFVTKATLAAFSHYWPDGTISLYSCFHKLSMLNDLAIRKSARSLFNNSVKDRRFASRLYEPLEDDKVFRFERVEFVSSKNNKRVDYVSLSDGEHQLAQILGTACMASTPNILFLLDEPESHFNPHWRAKFISSLMELPTNKQGEKRSSSPAARQECLLTTHSPFVPSDLSSENVFIFEKNISNETSKTKNDDSEYQKKTMAERPQIPCTVKVRKPRIETYGSTFDAILEECFGISPPMSEMPRKEIEETLKSNNTNDIRNTMARLGDSVEKLYLADRIRHLDAEK